MTALVSSYSGIVCDLDGVVYRGQGAVPFAVESLNRARTEGVGVVYATNNASRPPHEVVRHLSELGVDLEAADVVTSAMAGAAHLADTLAPGSGVLAIGGEGVSRALEEVGLQAVHPHEVDGDGARPAAVLQGFGRHVAWTDLAMAAVVIQGGARWVATNADLTVPTDRGLAPGNGTLVHAVRQAVRNDPEIVGKPYPPLYLRCAERLATHPQRTLAIGDRLDTDIAGAARTGMDSLFVLTGVNGARDIVVGSPEQRPTHLARDLRALHETYVAARVEHTSHGVEATCGAAHVLISTQSIDLRPAGTASERLRAIVAAGIHHVDQGEDLPPWPDVDSWILEGDS